VETADVEGHEQQMEKSYTPPWTPPALRRWGPRRLTTIKPTLEWRERL